MLAGALLARARALFDFAGAVVAAAHFGLALGLFGDWSHAVILKANPAALARECGAVALAHTKRLFDIEHPGDFFRRCFRVNVVGGGGVMRGLARGYLGKDDVSKETYEDGITASPEHRDQELAPSHVRRGAAQLERERAVTTHAHTRSSHIGD
jgi:hypothetical protein